VSAPDVLLMQQFGLSAHLRDPAHVPAPPGLEDRRVAVYRELVFANLASLLRGAFPVIAATLGEARFDALVRAFLRDHRATTPLFPELPRELVCFLDVRAQAGVGDPPWLPELAHYEWLEVALDYAEAEPLPPAPADFDPVAEKLLASPVAWPVAYAWPVHRIGPAFQPDAAPDAATYLLLQRDAAGRVRFHEIGAVAFRLLERVGDTPPLSGAAHVAALAVEAGVADAPEFIAQAEVLLRQLAAAGVIGPAR
jgi:hypothetical protein